MRLIIVMSAEGLQWTVYALGKRRGFGGLHLKALLCGEAVEARHDMQGY